MSCIRLNSLGRRAAVTAVLGCASFAYGQSSSRAPAQSQAGDGLHTIDGPGGGQVVYGTLTGQSSLSNAMVFMLRQVYGHFGDRPQKCAHTGADCIRR
jgi:hypothetical protein